MIKQGFFPLLMGIFLWVSCTPSTEYKAQLADPELFQSAVQNLSDIVVYDIFSPPVASRVYMYPTVAAYEILAQADSENYQSVAGQLSELTPIPALSENANAHLAALYAYNTLGKTLIFSEDRMETFQEELEEKIQSFGVPRSVRKASEKYAQQVVDHILDWAKGDLYNQTRTYPKYTILEEERFWKPTPPIIWME